MSTSLPDLTYKELVKLLKDFSSELREKGAIFVGKNKLGQPFTVHQHSSQRCHKQKLAKILRHLAISHDDFWQWYHHRR
jgi:predicted RNA binding protein YcfA (HicA-like mRNA interferase family)